MRLTGIAAACLLVALSAAGTGVANAAPGEVRLPGSVATAVTSAGPATGAVPANQQLTVQLWLKGNETGAAAFADSVSDPRDAGYRRYASPNSYTARFAASAASANAVSGWLTQQGFHDVRTGAQRAYVQASAPASTVQQAFQVQLKKFSVQGRSIRSNDRDVSLPSSIADDVLGITGLNSTPPKTDEAPSDPVPNCSNYFGQHQQTVPAIDGVTSVPTRVCGYTGSQLRAAYGMNGTNTGKGVTVAYLEVGAPDKMFQTLTTWAAANGLPAPSSQNYSELVLGSGAACGNQFDIEEQLDIEAGYAMAPDQHELMVGADGCEGGQNSQQNLFDALNTVLAGTGDQPLATIASNSWGFGDGERGDANDIKVMHAILLRAAAEGVGMDIASGDAPGLGLPQDDPYATGVGGTSLGLDADNHRLFETGWSNERHVLNPDGSYTDTGIPAGSSGGVSTRYDEPGYQRGVVPEAMARSGRTTPGRVVPDVSADGDSLTGMSVGYLEPGANGGPDVYSTHPVGGASLSCPLFAGIVAAAQQGQSRSFGFLNPLLYSLSGSGAFGDPLPLPSTRDVYGPAIEFLGSNTPAYVATLDGQDPAKTSQVTAPGYDTMTGLGTPNGQTFIEALRER